MSQPTLSVVMPNYNHSQYLPAAIEEIVNQTRPPDEFIILDDASTDNSVEIIESHAARYPVIKFVQNERNLGVMKSNERLFAMATGDYLYAGAADDRRLPRFFELAMQMAERYPDAGLIFGQKGIADEQDRDLGLLQVRRWQEPMFASPDVFLRDYLKVEAPSHSLCGATIYRRSAFEGVGGYRTDLGPWGDTFAARAVGLKHGACYVPEKFAIWRRLATSFSGQSRNDPRAALDLIAKSADVMRSGEFADCFPEDHVRRWQRRYRLLTICNAWLGEGVPLRPTSPAFWWHCLARLPRLPAALSLAWYRPRLSTSSTSARK